MTPREGVDPVAWAIRRDLPISGKGRFIAISNEPYDPASIEDAQECVVPLYAHPSTTADAAPFTYAVVNSLGDVVAGSKIEGGAKYKAKLVQRAEDVGETSADGPYRVVPLYAHPAATAREEAIRAEVIEECARVCDKAAAESRNDERKADRADDDELSALACEAKRTATYLAETIRALALARSTGGDVNA